MDNVLLERRRFADEATFQAWLRVVARWVAERDIRMLASVLPERAINERAATCTRTWELLARAREMVGSQA